MVICLWPFTFRSAPSWAPRPYTPKSLRFRDLHHSDHPDCRRQNHPTAPPSKIPGLVGTPGLLRLWGLSAGVRLDRWAKEILSGQRLTALGCGDVLERGTLTTPHPCDPFNLIQLALLPYPAPCLAQIVGSYASRNRALCRLTDGMKPATMRAAQ